MPLKFRSQPFPVLRERLPKALGRLWDVRAIEQAVQAGRYIDRPGLFPAYVFDCTNGLRLIISRDYDPTPEEHDGLPHLHVSVSYEAQGISPALQPRDLRAIEKMIDTTCTLLGLDLNQIEEQGFGPSKVAHHLLFKSKYTRQLCERHGITRQPEEQVE